MPDQIGARHCFFCGVSTLPGPRRRQREPIRSYLLTAEYIRNHPSITAYSHHMYDDRQINEEDRICRPCLLRADRFLEQQRRHEAEEEAMAAVEREAVEDVFDPSSSAPSEEGRNDPLRMEADDVVPDNQAPDVPQEEEIPQPNNDIVFSVPGFSRTSSTSTYCVVTDCHNRDLHRIPLSMRQTILRKQSIYIPAGTRVCEEHSQMYAIWADLASHCRNMHETFNISQMSDLLKLLQTNTSEYLNFEKLNSIPDVMFQMHTGFNKSDFLSILEETPSLSEIFKRPKTALATALCKLHTGESNDRLSCIFRVSPQQFGRIMKKARKCLETEFVPKHLGFDHIYGPDSAFTYRENLDKRILRIPRILFTEPDMNQAITICDGTYFYIQKSSNYDFQRKTYSAHKYRNLLKVFLIVTPDGYIVEIFGPYEANKSDSDIMKELISEDENNPFHWFFEQNDVFILDRGFRDCIESLAATGYKAYMPVTKDEGERQLTTQQANESCKVTLCRWVVETINGRLKNQFRPLRNQFVNIAAPHLYQEVKIACALINAFGQKLIDPPEAGEIINEIYIKYDAPNRLGDMVIANNMNLRRAAFVPLEGGEGFEEFPNLSREDLLVMALGPYQVAQARSYYGEHLKRNGSFSIEVYEDRHIDYNLNNYNIIAAQSWMIRGKIHSRYHNARVYFVYLLMDNSLHGRNKVIEHYCNCMAGKRTLGCCSHVMCIIWYMGWARHQEIPVRPPAAFLDSILNTNIDLLEEDD